MSYSDAMARTPLASPGCVVTSLTRSPRSHTSRCWSWSPLMYCRPVRAPMSGENRPERRSGQLPETRSLQALDVPGDVDDVLVGDETLPRRHRGARTAVTDDAQEILVGALEGAQVRRHRRPVRVGAVALRALREIGRPRGAHLRVQRGGRSRAGLREQDAVARENVRHLVRTQLLDRPIDRLLELRVGLADGGADREVPARVADRDRPKARILSQEAEWPDHDGARPDDL